MKTTVFGINNSRTLLLCVLFAVFIHFEGFAQVRFVINNLPSNTPPDASVFVAGNFNNWNPGDEAFRMEQDSSFNYTISFNTAPGAYQYKFTRGNWTTVEGSETGGFRPNRNLQYSGNDTTIFISILSWEDIGGPGNSTASPQVRILTDSFYMPQFDKYRRVWMYLPAEYDSSSDSFPVLYLHDGQNLFDIRTAFAGEWKIDESLDSLIQSGVQPCIVVGIDNGGGSRIAEYTPWHHSQYGGGQGELYTQFLVDILKPYIDSEFRTHSDSENTAIGGSSLGGLISIYAGLSRPDVFGKIAAFSSSFWFSDSVYLLNTYMPAEIEAFPKIYMIAGDLEGSNQVSNMYKFRDSLLASGWEADKIFALNHADGRHNEAYWAREFSEAYRWLFAELNTAVANPVTQEPGFQLQRFPSYTLLKAADTLKNYHLELLDIKGSVLQKEHFSAEVNISHQGLTPGVYIIRVSELGRSIWQQKLLISSN